jgi:hypothetical protein
MNIKIIALLLNLLIGVTGFFYVLNLIKTNAVQKKELNIIKINYERLEAIHKAERKALDKREIKYNEVRYQHSKEIKKLEKALADAKSKDDCVDRYIPDDVAKQLHGDNSTNQVPASK